MLEREKEQAQERGEKLLLERARKKNVRHFFSI